MTDDVRTFTVTLIRTANGVSAQVLWTDIDKIERRGEPSMTLNFPEENLRELLEQSETRTLRDMVEETKRIRAGGKA